MSNSTRNGIRVFVKSHLGSMGFRTRDEARSFVGSMIEIIDADGTGWVEGTGVRYEGGSLTRIQS
jgi:hypothetical protein